MSYTALVFTMLVCTISVSRCSRAQSGAPSSTNRHHAVSAATAENKLKAPLITNEDLKYKTLFDDIYSGDFTRVSSSSDVKDFPAIFGTYLKVFARQCPNSLSANKVPIMERYCSVKVVPVNRFGAPAGVESCETYDYRSVPGLFADPDAYRASNELLKRHQNDPLRSTQDGTVPNYQKSENDQQLDNALGMLRNAISSDVAVLSDVNTLLKLNDCNGTPLKGLQANMIRLADGAESTRSEVTLAPKTATSIVSIDANLLAVDLITADAATWMMNRFAGGVKARVTDRDLEGRPKTLVATYDVKGLVPFGTVKVTFSGGVPECLYFGDNGQNCKTPNVNVVNDYRSGKYKK